MIPLKSLSIFCVFIVLVSLISTSTHAATFTVTNNCPYTIWAGAVPGGGKRMNTGDTWTVTANPGQTGGRIWPRTGCTPSGANGLKCITGDCGGVLQCTAYGTPPNTLAEYGLKQFNNLDFFDISLVDGFNVPMSFLPVNGCSKGPTCKGDLIGPCPAHLKAPGGCNNPCTALKDDKYCCINSFKDNCPATDLSRYFKGKCPDAYSYPKDDATSTYTCPSGTNYRVTFCP
ncbi:alpha-amylase/trypsin inhibitor-like [Chenopodium quinoa]|uniref:alpha-amylase/trypsin inhibitor-like n=1 Tax=Chenopodium quinoa TaxID=63459 RepID=UPI000B777B64|nr:alpha-amylase/trypsin inhibitor-like [Chenopodium quinoa]